MFHQTFKHHSIVVLSSGVACVFPRKLKAMDSVTGQTLFQESNSHLEANERSYGGHVSNEKRSQTVGPGLYRDELSQPGCIGIIWSIMK